MPTTMTKIASVVTTTTSMVEEASELIWAFAIDFTLGSPRNKRQAESHQQDEPPWYHLSRNIQNPIIAT